FHPRMLIYITISLIATIASELSFTTYLGVYDMANMTGHLLKVLAFYFIFKGIIETGLREPYGAMFRNLKKHEEDLLLAREDLLQVNRQMEASNRDLRENREKLERINKDLDRSESALREQNQELLLARDQLKRSEKYFQDLFHQAPVCFVIVDGDGIMTEVNTTCETVLGLRSSELVGSRFEELIEEEERKEFRGHLQSAREKREPKAFTLTIRSAQGRPLRFVTELVAQKDAVESPQFIRLALLDITELDSLRKESHRLENLWNAVFSASREGFTITTLKEGRYLEVNQGYLDLTGYSREELIGRTVYDVGVLVKPKVRADLVKTLRKDDSEMRETQLRTKDGRIIDCLIIARKISLDDQELILAVLRDISETKKLKQSLEETCQTLEQRNVDLENFIHTAAHDLRTPLISTIGFFVLLKKALKTSDPNTRALIERISDQLYRYDQLLRDLLDFARVGVEKVERGQVDARSVVDSILEDHEVLEGERAHNVHIQENMPSILMNETRVHQIFENLISNSLKFRKKNQPLEIEVGTTSRAFGREIPPGFAVFFVRDNGIGIHPGDHNVIFSLFSRTEEGEKKNGTGVGLSIVKRILETEGGWIDVESEPDKGATFFLCLPVAEA
ncbi:MAG: PAS domain S-box protein, partial [Proteobacteria bacterium]|nr:PAS domain S-box protein [Pseudomonadota bacterium]